jgi:probable rRNA maturation factor
MQALDIVIEDARWDALAFEHLAQTALQKTLVFIGLAPGACEVSILACDDARIAVLNGDFREKSNATNVLSWPADERASDTAGGAPDPPEAGPDGMIELGDIAISYDTCSREAAAANLPMEHHVTHLIVHGALHLLGYDHINDLDADLMEGLEVKILGKMGIDNPYREM